jgi:CheY-like chemotaxis protein
MLKRVIPVLSSLRHDTDAVSMPKQAKSGAGQRVLIVEDSKDFADLLKFVLEDDGFVGVQFPVEGADIVAWAKLHKPAVILMDLALRHKNGREYIDQLKADPTSKKIPIIVVTGRDLSHREVLELQVMDVKYLRKGRVEMDEIRNEVMNSARGTSSENKA